MPDGIITKANLALARLLGYPNASALIGTSMLDLVDNKSFPDFPQVFQPGAADATRESVQPMTVWIRSKNKGDSFPCSLHSKYIANAAGRVVAVNIAIVDERRYAETFDKMHGEQEIMMKKEKIKQEFIAVASHELRTPIQPILGFALLAKKGMVSQEVAWDAVLQEARRLQQLATDILDVSRIEAGSLIYEFGKEKINELLRSLVASYRVDISQAIELKIMHDASELDFEVEIDRSRISQVFSNLISNAIKFTEKGSIAIETKALIDRNEFEIRVTDTGKGLSEQIMTVLFEKFATMGHGNVQNKKGTGLGLFITKSIVEGHKGSITACNNSGGGATFTVRLPISQHR
jgi:signal transduction histidine kinase